jgi:hypothetical protein
MLSKEGDRPMLMDTCALRSRLRCFQASLNTSRMGITWAAGVAAALAFALSSEAATLEGVVEQGGFEISDGNGVANILPDTTATLSIFLNLDAGEVASLFEGEFTLTLIGVLATPAESAVELEWTGVVANATGSAWSDTSDNEPGQRLVAQWLIDATGASEGDFFQADLGFGTFAGRDLTEDPFFELVPIDTSTGSLLARINVVPEPATATLVLLGLAIISAQRSLSR